jgi:hypothetical protein
MSYDRYKRYRTNGKVLTPAVMSIEPKDTDYFETYIAGQSRLDKISYGYYGDPGYDWLILMANPELDGLEFKIPDGYELRIPYPLNITLENLNNLIDRQNILYGID